MREIAQHQIDPRIPAQPDQSRVDAVGLIQLCAARHRNPASLPQLAGERADNEHSHNQPSSGAITEFEIKWNGLP